MTYKTASSSRIFKVFLMFDLFLKPYIQCIPGGGAFSPE
jgi:hypothetical protein